MSKRKPFRRFSTVAVIAILLSSACSVISRPSEAQHALNRGIAYAEQGELEQAIIEFDGAIELDPNYAAPITVVAWSTVIQST
jgi:Tfp pilus assembly protein PilF